MAESGSPDGLSIEPRPIAGASAPGGTTHPTRGFLFADLRDYTGYVERHGNRAAAALLERYRALVRGAIAAADGVEVRTEGDAFYVVFDAVSDAVRCGLAIVAAAAATAADPDPIRVGVGVHAGETIATADGYVGSAVNIAARLCAEAKAGDLVVSETVRGITRTSLEADFIPLGPRRLKGVTEPVACYRVVAQGTAPARTGRARPSVGGRRPWLVAAGLGLVAVVAVGSAVLLGGGGPAAPTPGPSAAAAVSPTAAASASPAATAGGSSRPSAPPPSPTLGPFPNVVEAAILAALPSAVAKTCVRGGTSDDASLAGFVGRLPLTPYGLPLTPVSLGGVTCGPTTGAKRLYVMSPRDSFWTGGVPADGYLGFLAGHYRLPYGSCATADRAYERWTGVGGTGMIACMNPYQGRPWIYFTFGDGRYLAFATRDDADYDALYAWFDQLKTFLP